MFIGKMRVLIPEAFWGAIRSIVSEASFSVYGTYPLTVTPSTYIMERITHTLMTIDAGLFVKQCNVFTLIIVSNKSLLIYLSYWESATPSGHKSS